MPFGSLIFVVIIAVWAAYLLQHWIRRRDHVATARSVDRFSEAMRVLERRRSLPVGAVVPGPAPRTYAVGPVRPAHPDVVVKRATSAPSAADRSRLRGVAAAPQGAGPLLRAVLVVLGFAALVTGAVTTALSLLPWWTALAGAGVFLLALGVVRTSVTRRRTSGAGSRPVVKRPVAQQVPLAVPVTSRQHARRPVGQRMTTAPVAAARVRGSAPLYVPPARPEQPVEERPSVASSATLYDLEAVEAATVPTEPEPARTAAADEPGTWRPVPVPTPTYMLKAKAHRPTPEGTRPVPTSRPVSELPFDGHAMALEEEFEELPAVNLG